MPRHYKRKPQAGLVSHDRMKLAVEAVIGGMTIRKASDECNVSKSTLHRYVEVMKTNPEKKLEPNYRHKQVFTGEEETQLVEYLIDCSNMFYGMTTRQTRNLAYEMAVQNQKEMPDYWKKNKEAGRDWLCRFIERNPQLSLRAPEATSLAGASAFNKANVAKFFNLLKDKIEHIGANAFCIYNLDESGCTTVQDVPKVLAPKGQKQVGQITSQERGELVTICSVVCANGSSLPPVFVFPRKNFKEYMLAGASEGSLGLASGNGWMNSAIFPKVPEHIIAHTRPTAERQIILVMDNHQSHLSLAVRKLAKASFIHIITLPPHTSNKTQPLDRSVFGPFKTYFNAAANSFMLRNPGKNITIYNMASLMSEAWLKASTPQNIISGFRVSGVWPLDPHVFSDADYLPSAVTDQPMSSQEVLEPQAGPSGVQTNECQTDAEVPRAAEPEAGGSKEEVRIISPADFRGYPKAEPRKEGRRKRAPGRAMIATSTPEMKLLEESMTLTKQPRKEKPKSSRQLFHELSDSDMDIDPLDTLGLDSSSESDSCDGALEFGSVANVPLGSYVLCEFSAEKRKFYYIGHVLKEEDEEGDLESEFFRKSSKVQNKFFKPEKEDLASFPKSGVKCVLPVPKSQGTTKRTKEGLIFNIDFGRFDFVKPNNFMN